jgi:MFS transporter, SHS family, sialic acid transporter
MTESQTLNRGHWIVLAASFLGWMFDGVEIGLFPVVVRPAFQSMGLHDDAMIGSWISYVVAAFLLGAAAGGLFFGWLGDTIGRVRAMVISILIYSLFTGACALAQAPWQLGVFRFIASLGMGGEWALAVALVMECWPERHRTKLAGAIGAAANFGILFIAVAALFKPVTQDSWRWIMLVGAVPALLALLISLVVPESERWKESVKKAKTQPLREIFSPRLIRSTLFAIVFSAVPLIGTWAAVSGFIPTWVDQMSQIEAGGRFLNEEQLAEFNAAQDPQAKVKLLKQELTEDQRKQVGALTARPKAWVQMVLAIGAIIGCFIAPLVGGAWGRRPAYFLLCLLSLLSCEYLFLGLKAFDVHFMAVTGFVGAVTAAFYGWLPLYLPELFPTRVRATGQGLSFNFGRIVAAFGAIYMGQLIHLFRGAYGLAMAVVCLIYIVGMVVIWFAPETKGKPLPE